MKNALTLRGVAYSALFAAMVVVFGYISIPLGFSPVPITLQTLAVMLAGGLLGPRYGFFSMLLVVGLTAVGLPLLQGGKGGLSVLLGTTGGYVVIWPIAALLIGYFVNKVRSNGWLAYVLLFVIMVVFGALLIYATGVPWLAVTADLPMSKALAGGMYPFIVGDLIKAAAAAIITVALRQVFPQARLTGQSHYAVRQS